MSIILPVWVGSKLKLAECTSGMQDCDHMHIDTLLSRVGRVQACANSLNLMLYITVFKPYFKK